jgi:hypothetical protein
MISPIAGPDASSRQSQLVASSISISSGCWMCWPSRHLTPKATTIVTGKRQPTHHAHQHEYRFSDRLRIGELVYAIDSAPLEPYLTLLPVKPERHVPPFSQRWYVATWTIHEQRCTCPT